MSMTRDEVAATIRAERIVAIVRSTSARDALATGRRLVAAGLRAVEVSLTTPDGLDAIEQLAAEAPAGVAVGAGTVLTAGSARAAIERGAGYLVSPVLAPAMLEVAHAAGVATVPGAGTATEMLSALELGADLVKVFPASLWTPASLAHLLEALPQLPLVPTGGLTVATAHEWLAAGAVAVGLGGALAHAQIDDVAAVRAQLTGA